MMKRLNVNLLSGLVLAIILLGVISAVTVYLNARTYRDLAFDFQRQYMTQLIAAESAEIIHEDADRARQLGLRIQSLPAFRSAFSSGDDAEISAVLDMQYQQAPVTSNAVDLIGLYAFDINFKLLGESTRRPADAGVLICPGLTSSARLRQGARRLKPLYELCLYRGEPYLAALAPVGGLSPSGYLQVVTSPISKLTKIGARLKMPVRVCLPDDSVLYVASAWSEESERNDVKVDYVLSTRDSQTALTISALRNADDLVTQIEKTNNRLLLIVALIIIATVMLALMLVKYSVLKPLRELSYQLRYIWTGGKDETDAAIVTDKDIPVSFHELGELYETLHDLAIRDPLTGTYNRALLVDRLKQVLVEHRRTPGRAAILLIDMVRFKYVNDLLGHHTGDLLLKNVVERIAGELRESDTLARLGGDEFVVILPDTDEAQAVQVAEKIIQSMYPDFEVYGHILTASVSIGIALMPEHGDEVDMLLHNADYAMYSAKDNKLGYAVYNPAITEQISHARMTLDGMLNADFENNDLFLVYQPVIDFRSGDVSYIETLVRWRQSDGRILMPDSFIRVAEKSGLIKQLSEWVIDTACGELAEMQVSAPELRVGVNLSMHNLHDFNLMAKIQSSLDQYGLQPESLLLEITETGVMLDPNQVIETLDQLAGRGFRLSIDDFGTGHSSLVYLKRLPVHTLKVDKSFVIDMDTDEENASIIRATIDLAHSLGLTVTAEGVETAAVMDRLRSMGCDYYQGYYVSRPMSKTDMMAWLEECGRRME
jgi:diguanylate cyclase (GGDEF)-like protein